MAKTLAAQAFKENRKTSDSPVTLLPIPENESEAFPERLREVVGIQKSLSFAKRCGFSDSLLGAYLRGEKKPGFDNLVTIAQVTGVTLDWLATGREPKFRRDVAAPASPEPAPDQASGEPVDLLAIYKEAPPEGRRALAALAVAIRDRTLRAWLAAGQAIAETAQLFDRTK